MDYEVTFAADAERDFNLIFDFLVDAQIGFGLDAETALTGAATRVQAIRDAASALRQTPHRGTRHDAILSGLRHLTLGRAVFWFVVDEGAHCVRVLAVFFGGQDHVGRMIRRLRDD